MRRVLLAAALLFACSETPTLVFDGPDPTDGATLDSSSGSDGGRDKDASDSIPDSGSDGQALRCGVGTSLCTATGACVGDCRACANSPIECVACDSQGNVTERTCMAAGSGACFGGAQRCACNVPADCKGPRQVCVNNTCSACGEASTPGAVCKTGGKCKLVPPADAFTCK